MTPADEISQALAPLVAALERQGVRSYISGSVASSAHGLPRATQDVDLVATLSHDHVQPLVNALEDAFYIDADMIHEAIDRGNSFNVIHLDTMLKLDVFVLGSDAFEQEAFRRAQHIELRLADDARPFHFASPEDVILHKLRWFMLGDEVSERQWLDVLGVLKVQTHQLDLPYLRQWAHHLGLTGLLQRALEEAGLGK